MRSAQGACRGKKKTMSVELLKLRRVWCRGVDNGVQWALWGKKGDDPAGKLVRAPLERYWREVWMVWDKQGAEDKFSTKDIVGGFTEAVRAMEEGKPKHLWGGPSSMR